jgi:hypothetical protein
MYHVFADLAEFAGGEVIASRSSDALKVNGLVVRKADRVCTLVANMSDEPCQVTVQQLGDLVRVRYLDETNVIEAMQTPEAYRAQPGATQSAVDGLIELALRPYAMARLDVG